MARPTKYRKKFCEVVMEVGAVGGWMAEMAEACDVSRNTMNNWADNYPEFKEALERAKQKAQAFMEKKGRAGLMIKNFNAPLWKQQMAARHPDEYTEKRINEHGGAKGVAPILIEFVGDDD